MLEPANHIPSEAFILALTASQTALRGFCQASLGHGEEAKEALQRTSIVLWEKCENWNPETDFLRWAVDEASEIVDVISDRATALETCLELLSDRNRETLSAYYVHGRSIQEVAATQGKGISALKVMLLRLRRKLGECVERRLAGGGFA